MKLRKLILSGFKSFADKTEFVFDDDIGCIVGPNGCGKSNVVDAVKWVLGEQSAKSLRGSEMMDVIFNGSATRKASGCSEVTLVFDNDAGLLKPAIAGGDERILAAAGMHQDHIDVAATAERQGLTGADREYLHGDATPCFENRQ